MVLEGKITPWALKLGTEGSGLLTCVLYILDSPRQHPYIEYEQYRTEARSSNILRVRKNYPFGPEVWLLTCVLYILESPRQHPYIKYEQYRTEARSLKILRVGRIYPVGPEVGYI